MASIIEVYERTYKDYFVATANASGVAMGQLKDVPQGYIFKILRYSIYTNSSGTPTFELFWANPFELNNPNFTPDRTRRFDYTAAGKNNISDNFQPAVLDEGEALLGYWASAAQNDVCYFACQIAVFAKWPVTGPHDHRALLHQEQIEDVRRNSAVVVGGSGWQYEDDPAGFETRVTENQDDLYANAYQPWAAHDPSDPRGRIMLPGMGQYVGGNRRGAQHPVAPYPPLEPGEGTIRGAEQG